MEKMGKKYHTVRGNWLGICTSFSLFYGPNYIQNLIEDTMYFGFLAPNDFNLNVADVGYTKNESCAIKLDIDVCLILSPCRYTCWWIISA